MSSPVLIQRRFFWSAIVFASTCVITLITLMVNNGHRAIVTLETSQNEIRRDWTITLVEPNIAATAEEIDIIPGQVLTLPIITQVPPPPSPDLRSRGRVVITNSNRTPQVLVATTRFLHESGVLFRLPVGVTVPANGQLEVELVSDQPGPQGDVKPGRFTIPGLSRSAQERVFATSTANFQGGTPPTPSTGLVLSSTEAWETEGSAALKEKVVSPFIFQDSSLRREEINGITRINAVAFDPAVIRERAQKILRQSVPQGYSVNVDEVTFTIQKISWGANSADITLSLKAPTKLNISELPLPWQKILGKTKVEAENAIRALEGVTNVEVTIQPTWRQTLPADKNRIIFGVR